MLQLRRKFVLLIILTIVAECCFARAGGGGAGAAVAGGILTVILAFVLAPFIFIYAIIMTVLWRRKKRRAEHLANKLAEGDKMWNLHDMKARVELAFFKVQHAWMERNQELAREYMSQHIYEKHKAQTDAMISAGTKNILTGMNILNIMITSVEDYADNSRDAFVALIKGRMTDYHIDEQTKQVIKGNASKAEYFEELWRFIRVNDTWVLDEIDQEVSTGDLAYARAYTHK